MTGAGRVSRADTRPVGGVRELVLHIGHPKTGTTALQTVLTGNRAMLLDAGVAYPAGSEPSGYKHSLARPYLNGTDGISLRRKTGLEGDALRDVSLRYWESLKAELRTTAHRQVVLSCENLFSTPTSDGFRQKLSAICDSVTVVAYLRSPAKRILSQLNQNVRMFKSFELPPAEFYRPVIEAYRSGGFDRISLNLFEPKAMLDGDVVSDFAAKYLPEGLAPLSRAGVERSNESVSNEALSLLLETSTRWLAEGRPDMHQRRAGLVAKIAAADLALGGETRPSLRPEVAEALTARSTDLPWLRDSCGIVFGDVDYGLVGKALPTLPDRITSVAQLCPVDGDRLEALRERVFGPAPSKPRPKSGLLRSLLPKAMQSRLR